MATIFGDVPTADVVAAFTSDLIVVERWVDIYEDDNVTLWRSKAPITEGAVSVDMTRAERRNLDVTFADPDRVLGYGPGAFWYDKVIKPYRGLLLPSGNIWVTCLGEFLIDSIDRPHFPSTIHATCRDFTKKLMLAKFTETTSFDETQITNEVIKAIALNAGITKFNWATPTDTLDVVVTFERGSTRWDAMLKLAESINHELFFDNYGNLTLRPNVDPLTAPLSWTFQTGVQGNLASFSRTTNDSQMFNHVIVYGDGPDNPLVFAEASNTEPSSPTNIDSIGERTYTYSSQVVTDNTQAQAIADSFLSVMGLEQYDMSLESIVLPWLEAGDAVEIILPDAATSDPTRFLLSNFSVPLTLDSMSGSAKRVTIVG